MSRAWPVMKREFTEMVRTRAYIIGTLLGPLLIVSFIALPVFFLRSGGATERHVLVIDATGTAVGAEIAAAFNAIPAAAGGGGGAEGRGGRFVAAVEEVRGGGEAEREAARSRMAGGADALDGYLFLPPDFIETGRGVYEGRNATSVLQMEQLRSVVTATLRSRRLMAAGVDPSVMARILTPASLDIRKPGSDGRQGAGAEASFLLGTLMAMAVYFAVVLFAASVMRGVLEEKRDRIVEVLLSSIRARQFMVGKVLGIGAASLLQMLVWVSFAALAIRFGPAIARRYEVPLPPLPEIPGVVALVFLFFFATGFLLYAALFGAAGAIATTDQEANQLQFPVTVPLLIGFFMMYALMADADSGIAVAGSIIPFTAPVVMPMRSMMTDVPLMHYIAAIVLMVVALWALLWAAAKIYRIGVLSTGRKPTVRELGQWLRTA